jgi:hypothetical protein
MVLVSKPAPDAVGTTSDAITEHAVLSRDHARIDSTLNWYFNFAQGDVGLRSNHAATAAVLINPKDRVVTNADAAEEAMFRAVEAVTRHRAVAAILARLSERGSAGSARRRCLPYSRSRDR